MTARGAGTHPSIQADLVVVGGGLGGVAAALTAGRLGHRTVLVSETDWLGGQVSSQAIPPDEHPWIETVGCTRTYRDFRNRVRAFYRRNYPLVARARQDARLNPGLGNIGPLSHEPHVAAAVLEEMLAPFVSRGVLHVLRGYEVASAHAEGDSVTAVVVRGPDGRHVELAAAYFLDATDLGDLVDAAGVEHVFGAESADDTGEPHAVSGPADPADQQPVTWAAILSIEPGTVNTIGRPAGYEHWRSHRPPNWPGPLLSWTVSDHVTLRDRERPLLLATPGDGVPYDLWHARRVLAASQLDGDWRDVTVAAWPMMDYTSAPLLGVGETRRQAALAGARELSLSFVHWMQTEAPRHDGGTGYPELRLRPDLAGTETGLAKRPYVRESRRIRAEFTLTERHIGVEARAGLHGAEEFADSVGIVAYRIDIHPSTSGRPAIDVDTWPFQLPLGAFVPVRVQNVLPAAKNIGGTHVSSGAYRVHPGEWTVGEAAAALAVYCLAERVAPAKVYGDERRVADLQRLLSTTVGVELAWPRYEALTPTHRFGYVETGRTDGA